MHRKDGRDHDERENNERSRHIQITDILAQTGGLQSMARELGISETEAARGAAALAPAIVGGFKKQAQAQPSGFEGLGSLLSQFGGGSLLDNVLAPEPTDTSRGNEVLGQVFGSKDVSRTVAQNASSQTGVDQSVLQRMLPMVAMMIAGYMWKQGMANQGSAGSGLGGLLGGLLGGSGGTSTAAGLASMLDMDRDGDPLDDILAMAGRTR